MKWRVGDDGCGFDAQASHRGYGLAGVVSKAGAGTVIEAEFPIS